jgi:hypothetical protein
MDLFNNSVSSRVSAATGVLFNLNANLGGVFSFQVEVMDINKILFSCSSVEG